MQVKIIAKCIDLCVRFWYYNFEIILCLKCNKIGNNKYRNFECKVWKAVCNMSYKIEFWKDKDFFEIGFMANVRTIRWKTWSKM